MSKSISIQESDFKCYTCQKAECMVHHNNLFRDILHAFKINDPENNITGIELDVDSVEITDKYEDS